MKNIEKTPGEKRNKAKSVFRPRIYKPIKVKEIKYTQFDQHFKYYKMSKKTL